MASKVLLKMMTMLNQIKLYHWQTLSHPRHIATDSLYGKLNDLIDKFIESLTGRLIIQNRNFKYRIELNDPIILKNNPGDDISFGYTLMIEYAAYLQSDELNDVIASYSDILNIRDEMLGEVNRISYLFSLH